jgi:two-component system NtrC family sensor kinase
MAEHGQQKYSGMKRLILGSMILVPLTLFIVVLGIAYSYFTTSIETSTIATMKRIVEDHRHMIDSYLRERRANLDFIIQSYRFNDLSEPQVIQAVFANLRRESHAFVDLGIFNEEGIHVAYQGPYKLVGRDYGNEAWFREVIKKGWYVSDAFLGYRKVPHFIIAIAREEGGRPWVIRATIDTEVFNNLVEEVRIGRTGEAYLLSGEGLFQTSRRSGGNLMEKDPDSRGYPRHQSGIETFVRKDATGEAFLYATTWLAEKDWLLVVRQQKDDAFSALTKASLTIVAVLILGISGIIAIATFLTERIVKRMVAMDQEQERLGGQLIRATRLAELGEMAAGFAHEINNPLQIIRSEHALMETILNDMKATGALSPTDDLKELEDSLAQIKLQVDRCAQITQAILKFGRKGEPVSQDIDLKVFVPEILRMVSKKANVQGIRLREAIAENTPAIHGDPALLQQVLLNLFNNAMDAIVARHGSSGGELEIGAGPGEDGKLAIWVQDNGCGIAPENLKKIFSPFFTTKPVGKGTGLGLSVCYGIIQNMGGVMEVESELGRGTKFTVTLSAAPQLKKGVAKPAA